MITAWSAVSPYGIGRDALSDGLASGTPAASAADGPGGQPVRRVPGFDPQAVLGRKGTRSLDRVTALALTAVGGLVAGTDVAPDTALVLGTTAGSAHSVMDFTRTSLTAERPHLVDPSRFPNTVMNGAAGRCAIRYGLKGPNATIAGGRAATLLALRYAWRLQRAGRARAVLVGGAEEDSRERHLLDQRARSGRAGGPGGTVPGEGCVVLRLEPSGTGDPAGREAEAAGLAEVVAVEFGVFAEVTDIPSVLASCLRRALAHGPYTVADLWAVAPFGSAGPGGEPEAEAVAALFPASVRRVAGSELVGDTSAAAAGFQIVAALTAAAGSADAAGRLAAITAVDVDGTVGCALLRVLPAATRGEGRP